MSKKCGQSSQTPEKGISLNASSSDGTGYQFGSLVAVARPRLDRNHSIVYYGSKESWILHISL